MIEIPKDKMESALAALEAERQARMEARLSAPDFRPALVWISQGEDSKLVIADHVRRCPEDAGADFILLGWSGDFSPRPELSTPQSLAAFEPWQAERKAREAAAGQPVQSQARLSGFGDCVRP
jgi:hypothetical protein